MGASGKAFVDKAGRLHAIRKAGLLAAPHPRKHENNVVLSDFCCATAAPSCKTQCCSLPRVAAESQQLSTSSSIATNRTSRKGAICETSFKHLISTTYGRASLILCAIAAPSDGQRQRAQMSPCPATAPMHQGCQQLFLGVGFPASVLTAFFEARGSPLHASDQV
jgi:hypothetical protein